MMIAPMPGQSACHTFDPSANTPRSTTTAALPMTEGECDCAFYRGKGRACPCSVQYAAKTGKRAVERILHKSVFFQDTNIAANVEIQTEEEAARSSLKVSVTNKVIQVEACHVDVGEQLGKGGFCLVHEADIILPQEKTHQHHDYCVKFLKPNILTERRKFARGIADLAIEAHFLATLNHPHILKIRGVTAGVKLFEPSYPDLTNQPGVHGGFFLILDRLHSTLDHKIERTWKVQAEKYSSFLYRTTHDLRGGKRMELRRQRLEVALQLARAMEYLHQYDICYRDLKPDNIGFDGNDSLKVFDFGLAKELKPYKKHEDGTYHLTANTGSRRYMAPVSNVIVFKNLLNICMYIYMCVCNRSLLLRVGRVVYLKHVSTNTNHIPIQCNAGGCQTEEIQFISRCILICYLIMGSLCTRKTIQKLHRGAAYESRRTERSSPKARCCKGLAFRDEGYS